jgi:hypothetical protein
VGPRNTKNFCARALVLTRVSISDDARRFVSLLPNDYTKWGDMGRCSTTTQVKQFVCVALSLSLSVFCWAQNTEAPKQPGHKSSASSASEKGLAQNTGAQNATAPKAKQTKETQSQLGEAESNVERRIVTTGDLSKVCPDQACPSTVTAIVLGNNAGAVNPITGKVISVVGNAAIIQFTGPQTFQASKVMILDQSANKGANASIAALLNVQDASGLNQKRVTLRGDFRNGQDCRDGYLSDVNLNLIPLTVIGTQERTATISYLASNDFIPDTVTLLCAQKPPITVPFTVFRGVHTATIGFTSQDITDEFCGGSCKDLTSDDVTISLQPFDSDAQAKLLRVTIGRVWVEVTALPEYAPTAVMVEVHQKDKPKAITFAKRLLGPTVDDHQPFVTYTVMDSEAEKANFGRRIAFNYLAINVQIHNPTDQKIQLNKARLWFDCDYAAIPYKNLYSNDPTYLKVNGVAKKYLFGIDHTQRQFPHTLQQVVGTFDSQTGFEKTAFDGADLSGSIFAALTGLFDSTQYSVAVNVFTGIFTPGMRKIIMNPDAMNQKRSSLLAQALDSFVQVPPKGASTTLVFVPRKGLLAWQDTNGQDQQIPVVIDLVRDVHFEPEIVIGVPGSTDQVITAGMTEDQVKKVLGDPTASTESNGQATYTFSTGPYKEVDFKKDGSGVYRVSTMIERAAQEQLVEGKTTVAEAQKLLGSPGLDLKDSMEGGKIWINPPLLKSDLLFGSDNILKKRDYQNALSVLKALKQPKVSDVKQKSEDLALTTDAKQKIDEAFKSGGQAGIYRIPSPDLAHEFIIIRCKDTKPTDSSEVTDIN